MYIHYFVLNRLQSTEDTLAQWMPDRAAAVAVPMLVPTPTVAPLQNEGWICDHKFKQCCRQRRQSTFSFFSSPFIVLRIHFIGVFIGNILLKWSQSRLLIKLIRFCHRKQFHSLSLESIVLFVEFLLFIRRMKTIDFPFRMKTGFAHIHLPLFAPQTFFFLFTLLFHSLFGLHFF